MHICGPELHHRVYSLEEAKDVITSLQGTCACSRGEQSVSDVLLV